MPDWHVSLGPGVDASQTPVTRGPERTSAPAGGRRLVAGIQVASTSHLTGAIAVSVLTTRSAASPPVGS